MSSCFSATIIGAYDICPKPKSSLQKALDKFEANKSYIPKDARNAVELLIRSGMSLTLLIELDHKRRPTLLDLRAVIDKRGELQMFNIDTKVRLK